METVTVSPKFQIVIPKLVRKALSIQPGQKVHVIAYQNRIELVPVMPVTSLRGFLQGIDTSIKREDDRV
ncbi:AbrB/MazE/SpoVT family DNA-binding domain-containing protein [Chloroflexi bacterium TSY]|nr:AbrB/MazE/SpoVT family DNA-binding domain-containing protein [Chloroflexi bacterium TSY]